MNSLPLKLVNKNHFLSSHSPIYNQIYLKINNRDLYVYCNKKKPAKFDDDRAIGSKVILRETYTKVPTQNVHWVKLKLRTQLAR